MMKKECLIKLSIFEVAETFDFSDDLLQGCISESLYSFYDLLRYHLRFPGKLWKLAPESAEITLQKLLKRFEDNLSLQDILEFRSDNTNYGICGEKDYLKEVVCDEDKVFIDSSSSEHLKLLLATTLKEIASKDSFSNATVNACERESLYSLYDIVRFSLLGNNFNSYGTRPSNELAESIKKTLAWLDENDIRIIKEFPSGNMKLMRSIHSSESEEDVNWDNFVSISGLKKTTLNQLYQKGIIKVRTLNVCTKSDLHTLYDIVRFHLLGGDFFRIQGSGETTVKELLQIVNEKLQNLTESEKDSICNDISNPAISDTTTGTDMTLQDFYELQLQNVSTRTRNVLKGISADKFVTEYLYAEDDTLRSFPNAGVKTIEEIKQIQSILSAYLGINDPASAFNPIPAILILFPELIESDFVVSYYHKTGHLPMTWILEHLLLSSSNKYVSRFLISTGYGSKKNIAQAIHKHKISSRILEDYVGQIHKTVNRKDFVPVFDERLYKSAAWDYILDILSKETIINKSKSPLQNICIEEECGLSPTIVFDFIMRAFDCSLFNFAFTKNKEIEYQQRNNFWIKKSLQQVFDFYVFFQNLIPRIIKNELPKTVNVREVIHISPCWADYRYSNFDDVVNVVYAILWDEFNLSIDEHGYVLVPSIYGNDVSDILYAILKKNGNPMHIDNIFQEFKMYFPNHKYQNSAQIRPALAKDDRITYRNRNSTFMLAEWEAVYRPGTIRDTIIEWLTSIEDPQSLKSITNYVLIFFPDTNEKSIRATMFTDTQKRFQLFEGNLIGLAAKSYENKFRSIGTHCNNINTFEEKLKEFTSFIGEYERMPSGKNKSNGESAMLAWWYRCLKRQIALTDEQYEQVLAVQKKCANLGRVLSWKKQLNEITLFIQSKKRLPYTYGEENKLYNWLRVNKYRFKRGNLSVEKSDAKKFIELLELINSLNSIKE